MPLSEHMYCVAASFEMTEQVEQHIYIKFCIKLEHSFSDDSKGHSYGHLVIGSFITTHLLMHHISCRVFWRNIKLPK